MEICQRKNLAIFSTSRQTSRIMIDIIGYLDEKLAPSDNLHGVLLSIYGKGVLIIGESGMGKSEIALELIRKGHVLIADDRVDVCRVHNTIIGRPPELLQGFLEIRGIGVIDIVQMFGASSILDKIHVDFVVNLERWDSEKEYARIGIEDEEYLNILDVNIPQILFPVKEGRNMAVLIESAVTNFNLKQMGIDSSKDFDKRVYDFILKQVEEDKKVK
jgi:HPr kinase/phosphorylase